MHLRWHHLLPARPRSRQRLRRHRVLIARSPTAAARLARSAEVAPIGAVEKNRREEAWSRIRAAVERDVLGETYAGLWIAKDGHCLVVAVTNQPEHAAATLRDIVPEAPLRVVWRRQPLAMLEALADTLIEMGDRLGAPWAYVGVCEPSNVVQAALTDLDHPASRALQEHFHDDPVRWVEDSVELATAAS